MLDKHINIGTHNNNTRNIWLEKTLKKIPAGATILDAGAGELQFKKYCGHLNYVSQDFGQYDGSGNNAGLQMAKWDNSKLDIVSDITAIPRPDKSFDAVMCTEVFEHIPDPIAAIKEFSRLIKHKGYLIITAPFCSFTHFAPFHFYSGFNEYFYKKHLHDAGFEIVEIDRNGNYFEYLAQEIRRIFDVMEMYRVEKESKLMKRISRKIIDLVTIPSLILLTILNKKAQKSEELICFGYHILARKK